MTRMTEYRNSPFSSPSRASRADLGSSILTLSRHSIEFSLESLDSRVRSLEILVESVSLGDQVLFPLPEPRFLQLDLLGELLAQVFFLFFVFWIVELAHFGLAVLACFHLSLAVRLVVLLFGGVDEIEHMCADQKRAELLEVAMLLVFDCTWRFSNAGNVFDMFTYLLRHPISTLFLSPVFHRV